MKMGQTAYLVPPVHLSMAPGMTTAELVGGFRVGQERRGLLPSTIATRATCLRSFARWMEPRGLLDATEQDVQLWLDGRRLRSARSRYVLISHLHCFYVWAIRDDLTTSDPTARIIRPKLRRLLPRPVSSGDQRDALELALPLMRAWLLLACGAGLRCAEIAGLTRDAILDTHTPPMLRIAGKGAKERLVPLHPLVFAGMRRLGLPRAGYVFMKPGGRRYSPAEVSRAVATFLDEVGVDATAHQFRHAFATTIYQDTSDLRLVQELLGHSSPATTAGYAAYSQRAAVDAVSRLDL